MVNQMMYDATLRAKVQQTVPCPQATSQQRGGRAGRDSPGLCERLVTQVEWNNLPPRDPPQPHIDDQTSLYLRLASTEAEVSIREKLLDTIGMTKELRAEAQQVLFIRGLVDTCGHLTTKGTFVSNLDCETEHGCLLWVANDYMVLPDAITIFTIPSRNPTFVSNEFKKLLPHPDGDLHTMLNAWNAATWPQQLTKGMETEPATKVWGKYNLSQRQFKVLQEYLESVVEKCAKQFSVPEEQLRPNQSTDKKAKSRLSLALFRAFKTSLLVRTVDGHYSMINDQDQWQISTTSTVKFAPSLVIAPSRTVRILGHQSKSEEPPVAKLEMVMGVAEEFLLSELWYCQNHKRNPWFAELVVTKRMTLRQKTDYWDNEELLNKVHKLAGPHIEKRRQDTPASKHLQGEINYLFDDNVRSEKEAHILAWTVLLHMHSELEDNSTWSLPPLHTDTKMSSIFNFIYHLASDLGSVGVMKALSQRGHSPRLYKCEEGYLHYPSYTHTLWADVGNAMYGYMNEHLQLVSDALNIGHELAGDVIEIAYNLYFMYAVLNIDVASLLGVEPTVLTGWWAQVTMIQRDACIQSGAMLGGKGCDTARFEQVCTYVSALTQLNAREARRNKKIRKKRKKDGPEG